MSAADQAGPAPPAPARTMGGLPAGKSAPREGSPWKKALGRLVLAAGRFRLAGAVPDVPRCVVIAAPHTSNWDFILAVATIFTLGLRVRWLGKQPIFRRPFRWFFEGLGGIPVDRKGGLVERAVALLQEAEPVFLAIAPEGTRRKTERWRTGFYHMATGAGVPILPVALDYRRRVIELLPLFHPTGHLEGDVAALQALFRPEMALRPHQY